MFIEDSEEPEWLHGSEFDLVHFRQMTDVLRDLKGLLTKIYPFVLAAAHDVKHASTIKEGG